MTRTEARARGLKRYFTGRPCPAGHVAERYVSNYRCVECVPPKEQEAERLARYRGMQRRLRAVRDYNRRKSIRRDVERLGSNWTVTETGRDEQGRLMFEVEHAAGT